jgi:hypothetical protein
MNLGGWIGCWAFFAFVQSRVNLRGLAGELALQLRDFEGPGPIVNARICDKNQ